MRPNFSLYDSKRPCVLQAIFNPPKAMRGGIPICFPQFGNCGALEQHGFIRNKMWGVDVNPPPLPSFDPIGKSFIDLVLKSCEDDLRAWPHRYKHCLDASYNRLSGDCFELRLRVSLASNGDLTLISQVRNVNGKPFSFSFAYLTYLSVSDISEVRIEGLETLDYLDKLCQRERFTEQGDAITFESAVDRIYLSTPNVTAGLDHEKKCTYVLKKQGLLDTVIWNPWEKKVKVMADFGYEAYKQMLCVNGAAIEKTIALRPGEEWTGQLELSVVSSRFSIEHLDLQKGVGT